MSRDARVSDIGVGICCCHPPIPCIGMSGRIITGSYNYLINGLKCARLTDIVKGNCGHIGRMITSSSTVIVNNLKTVRMGDKFTGCFSGTIVTGSVNQLSG